MHIPQIYIMPLIQQRSWNLQTNIVSVCSLRLFENITYCFINGRSAMLQFPQVVKRFIIVGLSAAENNKELAAKFANIIFIIITTTANLPPYFSIYIASCFVSFSGYSVLTWPESTPLPVVELNTSLGLTGAAILLLPFFLITAVFKVPAISYSYTLLTSLNYSRRLHLGSSFENTDTSTGCLVYDCQYFK